MIEGGEIVMVRDFIDSICRIWKEDAIDNVFFIFYFFMILKL